MLMMIWINSLNYEKLDAMFNTTPLWGISDTAWNPPAWLVRLEER